MLRGCPPDSAGLVAGWRCNSCHSLPTRDSAPLRATLARPGSTNKCPATRQQAPHCKCQTPLLCLITVLRAAVAKVQSLAPEGAWGGSRQPAYLSSASGIRSIHCQHSLWKDLMGGHLAKRQSSKPFCACASQTPNWLLSHLARYQHFQQCF